MCLQQREKRIEREKQEQNRTWLHEKVSACLNLQKITTQTDITTTGYKRIRIE